jgi:hypothetical protein
MFTLLQSMRVGEHSGELLPAVWKEVPPFVRGQLGLVVAGPGTGKSAFILSYALRARVPTIYFSADSDSHTQLTRSTSILTGWPMQKSAEAVRRGDLNGATEQLEELPIRFSYSAGPTLDHIEATIQAYDALYEDYPALIVVDNITNVRTDSQDDDPFSGLEALMDYLHELARETGSSVVGLHHVTGSYNNGDQPIPLSGVKGQIARVPELVLSLHRSRSYGVDLLNVSTLKNRSGRMDASGHTFTSLKFDADRMQIEDP